MEDAQLFDGVDMNRISPPVKVAVEKGLNREEVARTGYKGIPSPAQGGVVFDELANAVFIGDVTVEQMAVCDVP